MGYLHIKNLYADQKILLFKQCYASEKIHGTSAHISWNNNQLILHSGGAKALEFEKLFDKPKLQSLLLESFKDKKVTIYGEAYGGKEQGMSKTYGKELKFIAFDIQINDSWIVQPEAEKIATSLGLEFVFYELINATVEEIELAKNRFSTQAKKNGIIEDKISEGVVLRPLIEVTLNNGERLISKHKNDIYRETNSVRKLTQEQLEILGGAEEIANEWVTPMRLSHVVDKIQAKEIEDIRKVISAMVEDIFREAKSEIVESPEARKAISKKTAQLYKSNITRIIKGE